VCENVEYAIKGSKVVGNIVCQKVEIQHSESFTPVQNSKTREEVPMCLIFIG
jgi:hypothetical protein